MTTVMFHVEANFGNKKSKWILIERYARQYEAMTHIKEKGSERYRFRIVRVSKRLVFEEK